MDRYGPARPDSPLSEGEGGEKENPIVLRQKYRIARRERDATVVGVVFAGAMSIPTHGTSLFGLLFTIPRFIYYSKKLKNYRQRLRAIGIKPAHRTKRDYTLPVVMGAGSAALGTLLADVGVTSLMATPMNQVFAKNVPALPTVGGMNISLGQGVVDKALDFLFEGIVYPFNRVKKDNAGPEEPKAGSAGLVMHDGVKDMLLQWALLGDERDVYDGEEEFLKAIGRSEKEMLEVIEHVDELIGLAMEDLFSDEEREMINRHLTDIAIFDVMQTVFSSSQYQEFGQQDDGEVLRLYFKQLVLASINNIRKKKQIVQGFGREASSPISPEEVRHYGIKCNACEDLEIEGVRYNCGTCEDGVNYCYECFFADAGNDEHVLQHKWFAFYSGPHDSVSPLPIAPCFLCQESMQDDRFNCQDCDQFDVCQDCFQDQGKTLHETHTFVLLTHWGFTLIDRESHLRR